MHQPLRLRFKIGPAPVRIRLTVSHRGTVTAHTFITAQSEERVPPLQGGTALFDSTEPGDRYQPIRILLAVPRLTSPHSPSLVFARFKDENGEPVAPSQARLGSKGFVSE